MGRFVSFLMITVMALTTTGCSRFNFLKTSTTEFASTRAYRAETVCLTLGTSPNDSSYEKCIAEEDRAHGREGWTLFPVPVQSPNSYATLVW